MGERIDWVELGGGVGPVQPAKVTGGGEQGGGPILKRSAETCTAKRMYCDRFGSVEGRKDSLRSSFFPTA